MGGNFATFGPAPLTVTAGPPALIKYIMGNLQTVNVGVVAPIALTAEVTDVAGNPLTGASVVWTVTAGSATELQPVAGNNQQAPAGTAFSNPVVVQVVDNAAPVQGAIVRFSVGAGNATLSAQTATTNALGQAQVIVTAGATPGPVVIVASTVSGGRTDSANFTLTVTPAQSGAVIISQVDNAGGYQVGAVVPGSQVVIFGQGLTPQGPVTGPTSGTWPLSLGGVTVTFTSGSSSLPAPIFNLSNQNGLESVTVQAPFELSLGNAQVTVTAGGVASQPFPVTVDALLPGIFQAVASDGREYAVAQRPDGTFVSPTNPARPGEQITIQVTGLGQVSPSAATNQVGAAGQNVLADVIVGVNNSGVPLFSAVYSPGQIGLYTVTFQIPDAVVPGTTDPFAILVYEPGSSTGVFGNGSLISIGGSAAPSLSPTPASLTFNYQQGGSQPPSQVLTIASSAGSALPFTAAAATTRGGNWLSVSPASGTTSAALTVSVSAAGLAPGSYTGSIAITSAGAANSPLSVPVTLNIATSAPNISGLLPPLAIAGGPPFTLAVNGSGFLSSAVVEWNGAPLSTTYVSSSQLTAAVPASLIPAAGIANVTVANPGGVTSNTAPFTIAAIYASPQALSFTYQQGGTLPSAQTVSVFSNGAPLKYSVTASANWLKATAGSGQTPDNVTVSLPNLSSLPSCPGPASCISTATVSVAPQGSPAAAATIVNVTLTVTP
ncbi:MAG: hypothetical protein ABSG43_30580, partial [Solirubrobacteraceae bacterium]